MIITKPSFRGQAKQTNKQKLEKTSFWMQQAIMSPTSPVRKKQLGPRDPSPGRTCSSLSEAPRGRGTGAPPASRPGRPCTSLVPLRPPGHPHWPSAGPRLTVPAISDCSLRWRTRTAAAPAAWPRRQRLRIGGCPRAEPGRAGGLTGRARAASPRRPPPPPAWAATTAEAARRRRRRAGGGSEGGFLGPCGLAWRSVRRGSAAAPEPGRHPLPGSYRDGGLLSPRRCLLFGGSSFFVWVRCPTGSAGFAPAPTPATTVAGGERRQRLLSSSHLRPPNPQHRPAQPSRVTSRGPLGPTGRARRASEPHSGAHRASDRRRPFCNRAQGRRVAAELWVPTFAARPAPSARGSLSQVAGEAQHGACAPQSVRSAGLARGRGNVGARPQESASPRDLLGACSRLTPQLPAFYTDSPSSRSAFYTDSPSSRPSQDSPDSCSASSPRTSIVGSGIGKWRKRGIRAGHDI